MFVVSEQGVQPPVLCPTSLPLSPDNPAKSGGGCESETQPRLLPGEGKPPRAQAPKTCWSRCRRQRAVVALVQARQAGARSFPNGMWAVSFLRVPEGWATFFTLSNLQRLRKCVSEPWPLLEGVGWEEVQVIPGR